jgi:hypothetical protein
LSYYKRPFRLLLIAVSAVIIGVGLRLAHQLRRAQARRAILSTMAEMHGIRAALNAYAEEHHGAFPPPATGDPDVPSWDDVMIRHTAHVTYPKRSVKRLEVYLRPYFSRPMPETDTWGRPILAAISRDRRSYVLVSAGSDGRLEASVQDGWPASETWHDLVVLDGTFISAPEGVTH